MSALPGLSLAEPHADATSSNPSAQSTDRRFVITAAGVGMASSLRGGRSGGKRSDHLSRGLAREVRGIKSRRYMA
jgi:hypothetical protein